MKKCLNDRCQKEFEQPEGKRDKKYCSDSCRSAVNQRKKTKTVNILKSDYDALFSKFDIDTAKKLTFDLYELGYCVSKHTESGLERVEPFSKEALEILSKNAKVEVTDLNKQSKGTTKDYTKKPPATNYSIDTENKPPVFKNNIQRMVWEAEQKIIQERKNKQNGSN